MKLRIKFTKHGAVRYIGHLDTQRYFQRVNRRAGLKVVYSEGFSPHQKMAFAMPLSVGYESDAEYFDVEVRGAESSVAIVDALNKEQAEGIRVVDCVVLPEKCENAMASVRAAYYGVRFREGYEPPFDMEDAIRRLTDIETYIIRKENKKAKKRKGKIAKEGYATLTMKQGSQTNNNDVEYKEVDLRHLIYDIHYHGFEINMKVSAGSKDNVKPELVISSLYKEAGVELPEHALLITRKELYTFDKDGETLIPLLEVGERF